MLEVLNSSANFLIYFSCHRYFRPAVTRCPLFTPSHRQPSSDHRETRSPAPLTQPDVLCLQELHDGAETAGNYDPEQQQQQQQHIQELSSDADLNWRNNGDDAREQTVAMKMSRSSTLAT